MRHPSARQLPGIRLRFDHNCDVLEPPPEARRDAFAGVGDQAVKIGGVHMILYSIVRHYIALPSRLLACPKRSC